MKNDIRNDLNKLKEICYNLFQNPIKKYFILLLAHYSSNEVHEDIFAYGAGHNRKVTKFKSSENLSSKASEKTYKFFKDELKKDYHLKVYEPIITTLGQFRKKDIELLSFLVEFVD